MDDPSAAIGQPLTRRSSLARLGGLALAGLGAGWLRADASEGAGTGPAGVATGAVSCVLAPEQTAGPYYLPGDKLRSDIREGKKGVLLGLRLTVVDASTCRPIRGAAVDVWHCDAGGLYSGTSTQGTEGRTFLRGIQRTNANGVAVFKTIYPGWYPGRTVHIHVKVSLGGNIVHTGQLYFPDAVTDVAYRRAPYASRPNRNPRNAGDSIFRNGGSRSLLTLKRSGTGYAGAITMGVLRS
jgi:protocatechuate 3,4-dioxygenase beta subunit